MDRTKYIQYLDNTSKKVMPIILDVLKEVVGRDKELESILSFLIQARKINHYLNLLFFAFLTNVAEESNLKNFCHLLRRVNF